MQTELVIQNPHASKPLHIPLTVDCNVLEETVLANVLANSRKIKAWVKTELAHGRVALLCGGGPSLADSLAEVVEIQGDVIALNGAAKFLHENGIEPDYQVLMDARPESADLIGPAKQHLFASQVDPICFDRIPHATLWHATHGDLEVDKQEGFPEHHDGYCLIGGAISVGNTALVLLYALGYRTIHIFGMDCSQRDGKAHAYSQPLNDGEPCTIKTFMGKDYICSISMSLQAKHFMSRARQLLSNGCSIHVHGSGLLPSIWNHPSGEICEREKYEKMWTHTEYRQFSPGEDLLDDFLGEMQLASGDSVYDFGCGPGRATDELRKLGFNAAGVDIAANCRDPGLDFPLIVSPLWDIPEIPVAQFGYCCDVMEHIPANMVNDVLRNIQRAVSRGCYFQIAFVIDGYGPKLIGEDLHLTIQPKEWWAAKLKEYFQQVLFKHSTDSWRGIFICRKGN